MEQQGTSTPGGVTASDPMPGTSAKDTSATKRPAALTPGEVGETIRGEVPGCPTGLAGLQPAGPARKPDGGEATDLRPPYSPGEGVTEQQRRRSGGGG